MIRLASPDDAPAVAELEALVARHPWSLAAVEGALRSPVGFGMIALDPEPVGYALAQAVTDEGELHAIGVSPPARRRGLASELLAACESEWSRRGVARVFLEVAHDNTAARALYDRRGWREVGRRKGYYGDGVDGLILEWRP